MIRPRSCNGFWAHDSRAVEVLKAAQNPTSTTNFPAITTTSIWQSLAPASASAQLFSHAMQISLQGVNKVRIPHAASVPQPGFVPEGSAAPLAQFSLAGVDLGPVRKILILTSLTGELENATPEAASAIIGKTLAEAVAQAVDAAVFSSAAADSTRPAGLFAGVVPNVAATGSTDVDAATTDIANLAAEISSAGIDPSGMIIVAAWPQAVRLQMLSGANFKYAIVGTNALPDGTVAAFAPAGVAVGYSGTPEIEVTKEGAVHFEDTTPLPIASGAQGSATVGSPVKSAFQQNLLVVLVRARCAWSALPGAVQIVPSVSW